MTKTFEDLISDHDNVDLPRNFEVAFDKIKCKTELCIGKRIYWYFKDDLSFSKMCADESDEFYSAEVNARKQKYYSGIIVPWEDTEMRGGELEVDDCIVVMDRYPCEKCYPEATWFHLKRLLDNENLIEIYD